MSHWLASPPTMRQTQTSTTLTDADDMLIVTTTGQTVTLPSAVGRRGMRFCIKNGAVKNTTVVAPSGQTIDGQTSYIVGSAYGYVEVISDGTSWITC